MLELDVTAYNDALAKALRAHVIKAARAFVRVAASRIPVDTGMARGSFLNIGRFLNEFVTINPKSFNKKYYGPRGGTAIPKTPESGAALTTSPDQMIQISGNRVTFQIESRVFHLTLEDEIGVRSPRAPWESFRRGREAFMEVMRQFRAPNLKSFVTKTTISYGRGSPTTRQRLRLRAQEKINA